MFVRILIKKQIEFHAIFTATSSRIPNGFQFHGDLSFNGIFGEMFLIFIALYKSEFANNTTVLFEFI